MSISVEAADDIFGRGGDFFRKRFFVYFVQLRQVTTIYGLQQLAHG